MILYALHHKSTRHGETYRSINEVYLAALADEPGALVRTVCEVTGVTVTVMAAEYSIKAVGKEDLK